MGESAEIIRSTALLALTFVAAVFDVRIRRIPSWLTLPGIVGGLCYGALVSTLRQFLWLLAVTALTFAAGFVLYMFSILGGGDGKLLTAVAALAGPGMFAECIGWIVIAAIVISIAILGWSRALLPFAKRTGRAIHDAVRFGIASDPMEGAEPHRMPFALVIFAGVLAAVAAQRAGVLLLR